MLQMTTGARLSLAVPSANAWLHNWTSSAPSVVTHGWILSVSLPAQGAHARAQMPVSPKRPISNVLSEKGVSLRRNVRLVHHETITVQEQYPTKQACVSAGLVQKSLTML